VSDTRAKRSEKILLATLEQLAVVGFRALSIEDVAASAGVNKTTVYRRWPTKIALISAAMESFAEGAFVQPDTGSLRSDLLALARTFHARASSLLGQSLFRTMGLESTEAELQQIGTTFRLAHETMVASILSKALARGEIDRLADHRMVTMLVIGPLHLRMFVSNEAVDEPFIARLVDTILAGLLPRKVMNGAGASRRR
jgi:AcrR family transcriptional regulator